MHVSNSDLTFLQDTLLLAGEELARRHGEQLQIQVKADASLVTDADLASEKIILDAVSRYYPQDKIYSEEAGLSSKDRTPGSHIWIIDPLDGTTNFANGYPFYCVSIGRGVFGEDGKISTEIGGIYDPCRQKLYMAHKNGGATVNGKPLRAAPSRDFSKCFLVTGFYYMRGDDLRPEIERFARVAQACQSIRRDGSAALDLALVAEGIYDAFWENGLQPWDLAAGVLLVAEAGGKVQNYKSPTLSYNLEMGNVIAGAETTVGHIDEFL